MYSCHLNLIFITTIFLTSDIENLQFTFYSELLYLVFSQNSPLSVASGPSITQRPQKTPFTLAGVPVGFMSLYTLL